MKPLAANILVVTVFDWHRAILDPLVKRFREWREVDYSRSDDIVAGWRPERDPHLVIVCDAGAVNWLRGIFPQSMFMHVGHGLISKNQTSYHYKQPDFVCVASRHIEDRLTRLGHAPRKRFFATGLIQTDPLFTRPHRAQSSPTVVYAPTWNESLTSAAMFGDRLVERIRGERTDITILIKPHPHITVVHPEWIEMWSEMQHQYSNVMLCDPNDDLIPTILKADVMLSDASSAVFHFLALNRPIVLVNNPQRFDDDDAFDPNGIEWQWRDIAEEVEAVEEVSNALERALMNPESQQKQRLQRRDQLFGGLTDGRSCERVHSAVVHVLETYV